MGVEINNILGRHKDKGRSSLIPILQEVQEEEGFLSPQSILKIGEYLELPASKIYGVATFYNQFRFHALGQYHIQVCRGTACHVRGSQTVLDALRRELKVEPGQTTKDGVFSLEVVACIGACGLAPVIAVNGQFHARVTDKILRKLLAEYRAAALKSKEAA